MQYLLRQKQIGTTIYQNHGDLMIPNMPLDGKTSSVKKAQFLDPWYHENIGPFNDIIGAA